MDIANVEMQYSNTIEKYNLLEGVKNIIYLFSGGKDASFGLHLLCNYIQQNDLDINLTIPMVLYPQHVYMRDGKILDESKNVLQYWENRKKT